MECKANLIATQLQGTHLQMFFVMSVCLSVYLSLYVSDCLSVCLHASLCTCTCMYVCLNVCISLAVCKHLHPSTYLCVNLCAKSSSGIDMPVEGARASRQVTQPRHPPTHTHTHIHVYIYIYIINVHTFIYNISTNQRQDSCQQLVSD